MKKLLFPFLTVLLACAPSILRAQGNTTPTWDAARDLIANEKPDGGAQELTNPIATVPQWSYGYRTGIENTNLTLFKASEHSNHFGGPYEGLEGWASGNVYGAAVYPGGTSFTVGSQDPLAPNEIFTSIDDHSGSTNTVIRWTCPAAGQYTYKVAWHDLDPGGGDGAAGYVVINGVRAFGASWPNGRGQGAATGATTVNLNAGDVIDVLLNSNGPDSSYDTAGISVVVFSGTPPPPTCAALGGLLSQFSAEGNTNDSQGQNNGTAPNGITYAAGEVGQAFSLNGAGQYVSVPDATALRPESVTIEGWVYLTSLPHEAHVMAKSIGSGTLESFSLYFYEGTLQGAIGDANLGAGLNSGFAPQLNRWYHVAYTFDRASKTHALYVDGVRRASAVTDQVIGYDTHPVTIGAEFQNEAVQFFFPGKIDEISLYGRALSPSEVEAIYTAGSLGKCAGSRTPAHGGLSDTTLLLNESTNAPSFVDDTVLRFRSVQNGRSGALQVRVQASTDSRGADAPASAWTNLPDATGGLMAYQAQFGGYALNTTSYPTGNGVFFRSVSFAPGYPASISNVVGPCNLTSSRPHLGSPLLFVTTNGEVNAIRFGAKQADIPSGIDVRVQTSKNPADEASWTDAPIGTAGHMTQDNITPDAHQFYLGTDDYPDSEGVYFRAIASAPGYVDGLSFAYGPFKFVKDPAATVSISVNDVPFPNGNDIDSGGVLPTGAFKMNATATSGRFIKRLTLLYDGITIAQFVDGATTGTVDYKSNIPGDHIVEAYATDDLGVTGAAPPVHVRVLPAAPGRVFTMIQSGNWNDPGSWAVAGDPGTPGRNDFAILGAYTATLTTDVTVNAVSLDGGTINGAKTLTVTAFCTIGGGNIRSNLTIPSGSTCEFLNDEDIGLTGLLDYTGTVRLHGKGGITGVKTGTSQSGAMNLTSGNNPDGLFDGFLGAIRGVGKFFADLASGGRRGSKSKPASTPPRVVKEKRTVQIAKVELVGGLVASAPAPSRLVSQDGGGLVASGGGNLVASGGGNLVASGGGNLVASGGGNLVASGGGNLVASGGGNLVASGGGNLVASGGGNLVATGGGNLVASGGGNLVASGGGNFTGPRAASETGSAASTEIAFAQTGGEMDLSGFVLIGSVTLDGGVLSGSGLIFGDLTNNGAFISPGHSAGAIGVEGNFSQGGSGTLVVENGGTYADQFDQLQVDGAASLGGNLLVNTINGYTPDAADTFNPLGYSSATGSFASVSGNAAVAVNATGVVASVDPAKPSPRKGQPLNIATRLQILGGDNGLIEGFIITGAPGSTKKVLIRGLGPSTGVSGAIADPLLQLKGDGGVDITNDDWQQGDTSQIPAGFSPSNPKESLIVATLTIGSAGSSNFTAILKDAKGQLGIGLAEVYDLDSTGVPQLANIATRGLVQTGDNVMIGGFIIGGTQPAKVLVRVTGPTLTNFGISGALADPTLELHDSNGGVISNDNWQDTQEAAIKATGIPPANSLEPAILATLPPGNYTAVVRGTNDTTGIAVVEAYNLQ